MKLLNEELIILDADVSTAEDCIRLMGQKFEELGYVKEGYADAVVEREAVYPTGLPGKLLNIAIPHTNNLLVNKPAVGVIVPKSDIKFCMMGQRENVLDCSLIMPLVIADSKKQITMLKKMMKIIQDGERLQKIKLSKSKSEIIELLSSLEEE